MNEKLSRSTDMQKRKLAKARALNLIGVILVILLTPIVIINITMAIQSLIDPHTPPNFMGNTPLIVSSGSMFPTFDTDDLIIVKKVDNPSALGTGDIICYLSGEVLVTHRIVKTEYGAGGEVKYVTQGDANNTPDSVRVSPEQVIGVYRTHFSGLGSFALFMQSPTGMIIFLVIPLVVLFSFFYISDRMKYKKLLAEQNKEAEASVN